MPVSSAATPSRPPGPERRPQPLEVGAGRGAHLPVAAAGTGGREGGAGDEEGAAVDHGAIFRTREAAVPSGKNSRRCL